MSLFVDDYDDYYIINNKSVVSTKAVKLWYQQANADRTIPNNEPDTKMHGN